MIILDSTTRSLVLSISPYISSCIVTYTDQTSSAFTLGTQVNSGSSATILSAPSAGVTRTVNEIILVPSGLAVGIYIPIYFNDNGAKYPVAGFNPANQNEILYYTEQDSWKVLTNFGIKKSANAFFSNETGTQFLKPYKDASTLSSVTTAVSVNAPMIVYMGIANTAGATFKAQYRVTTAAATITYCELALYSSPVFPLVSDQSSNLSLFRTLPLTKIGAINTAAVWNTTGIKTSSIPTSGLLTAGSHMFLVFAASSTTSPIFRGGLADDLCSGVLLSANGVGWRPTTAANSPIYITANNTTIVPWVAGTLA